MNVPIMSSDLNIMLGTVAPSMVHASNNISFTYWQRSLYQRAVSKIDADVPENWEGEVKDFLMLCLLSRGWVFVSKAEKLGYWFNFGSLYGQDFYYQPTKFILANPNSQKLGLGSEYELHKDGELLKFMPDYCGIFDIINYYAEKLASLSGAVDMNIINSKVAFLLGAKDKGTANTLKAAYDRVNKGEPLIILDRPIMDDVKGSDTPFQFVPIQKIKDNYIVPEQLVDMQTILNMFDAEIGITTVPYQKKERMVTGEADSREEDSKARITVALECLESSVANIKQLYPDINLSFKIRTDNNEEVEEDGRDNIDRNV